MQASRNGYFFVLDRTNGKNLLTKPFAAVNWAKGIDEQAVRFPIRRRSRAGRRPGRAQRRRRDELPAAELRSQDRAVDRQRQGRLRHLLLQAGARRVRLGRRGLRARRQGRSCAPSTTRPGKIVWEHAYPRGSSSAGVLTTDTDLTITGDAPATCWPFEPATARRLAREHRPDGRRSGDRRARRQTVPARDGRQLALRVCPPVAKHPSASASVGWLAQAAVNCVPGVFVGRAGRGNVAGDLRPAGMRLGQCGGEGDAGAGDLCAGRVRRA